MDTLENRQLLSCTFNIDNDSLTVVGNGRDNDISVIDDATTNSILIRCDGVTHEYNNISNITIKGNGGDDSVDYWLDSGLAADQTRTINILMGGGSDWLIFDAWDAIYGEISLNINGGAGSDDIDVTYENINEGAVISTILDGGRGDDWIWVTVDEIIHGHYFKVSGGDGYDVLSIDGVLVDYRNIEEL